MRRSTHLLGSSLASAFLLLALAIPAAAQEENKPRGEVRRSEPGNVERPMLKPVERASAAPEVERPPRPAPRAERPEPRAHTTPSSAPPAAAAPRVQPTRRVSEDPERNLRSEPRSYAGVRPLSAPTDREPDGRRDRWIEGARNRPADAAPSTPGMGFITLPVAEEGARRGDPADVRRDPADKGVPEYPRHPRQPGIPPDPNPPPRPPRPFPEEPGEPEEPEQPEAPTQPAPPVVAPYTPRPEIMEWLRLRAWLAMQDRAFRGECVDPFGFRWNLPAFHRSPQYWSAGSGYAYESWYAADAGLGCYDWRDRAMTFEEYEARITDECADVTVRIVGDVGYRFTVELPVLDAKNIRELRDAIDARLQNGETVILWSREGPRISITPGSFESMTIEGCGS